MGFWENLIPKNYNPLLGWLGSHLFGGKTEAGEKPGKPEMGEFSPYMFPWDTTAFESKLGEYGKEQRKGIYERSAEKGTYYGAGGTVPGETDLASQMTKSLADYEIMMQQMQAQNVYRQYMAYIEQKYGLDSMEYRQAYGEYMAKMQQGWTEQGELMGGLGSLVGTGAGFMMGGQPGAMVGGQIGGGLGGGSGESGMGDWYNPYGGYG